LDGRIKPPNFLVTGAFVPVDGAWRVSGRDAIDFGVSSVIVGAFLSGWERIRGEVVVVVLSEGERKDSTGLGEKKLVESQGSTIDKTGLLGEFRIWSPSGDIEIIIGGCMDLSAAKSPHQ